MSPEQAILTLIGAVLLLLFVMPAVMLALAARTNHHVRQDLPASPRLKSATRWNFWTGGMASWGGALRLALADPRGLDDFSAYLRSWCRLYLATCLGTGLLICLIPESNKVAGGVATFLSFLPILYFLSKLRNETQGRHEALTTAAQASLKWFSWALGLAAVAGTTAGVGLTLLAAPVGLAAFVLIVKASIHFCRLGLIIGIEGLGNGETADTAVGGKDAGAMVLYFLAMCIGAAIMQGIGVALFG